jgi:hypothetical protein
MKPFWIKEKNITIGYKELGLGQLNEIFELFLSLFLLSNKELNMVKSYYSNVILEEIQKHNEIESKRLFVKHRFCFDVEVNNFGTDRFQSMFHLLEFLHSLHKKKYGEIMPYYITRIFTDQECLIRNTVRLYHNKLERDRFRINAKVIRIDIYDI